MTNFIIKVEPYMTCTWNDLAPCSRVNEPYTTFKAEFAGFPK